MESKLTVMYYAIYNKDEETKQVTLHLVVLSNCYGRTFGVYQYLANKLLDNLNFKFDKKLSNEIECLSVINSSFYLYFPAVRYKLTLSNEQFEAIDKLLGKEFVNGLVSFDTANSLMVLG